MCTCIHQTGGGFFEGMCRLENWPLLFAIHPHPSIGELTSASLGISQQAARVRTGQVESTSSAPCARSGTYVRGVLGHELIDVVVVAVVQAVDFVEPTVPACPFSR